MSSHPFSDGVHGLWVNGKTRDYVFYNQNTHRIHKIHIVLHELGHIVLGHRGKKLPALLKELLVDLEQDGPPPYGRLHTSQITQDEDEHAAEWFVRCVQVELMQVERLAALTGPPSSLESVTRFARSLGYNG
ncbi:MAG: ImmA/IrrE family metallo-endopeptidase [Chloroflexi bacterium]|nr:ImmA/IrrE family metallo-endopeptidase [Chloroflexota bacterium]